MLGEGEQQEAGWGVAGRPLCSAETGICEMPAEDSSQAVLPAHALPTTLLFWPAWGTVGLLSWRNREGEGARGVTPHSGQEAMGPQETEGTQGQVGQERGAGVRCQVRAGHPGHWEAGWAVASREGRMV